MVSFDRCSFKIFWIMIQVVFRSYAASIDYFPRLHPSENPDCSFRSSKVQQHYRNFEYRENYSNEPSIEIRAILVPCQGSSEKTHDERSSLNSNETFYEDSKTSNRERIGNCHKKLIISLKLNNVGKIRTEDEYVVVSQVLDPITMQKTRLNNPYVIKIRREPVLQLYPLKFERVVNAEAREQIIIKREVNNTSCNDGMENPTCGVVLENGVPVPFSQGFCCSCDTGINKTRQTRDSKEETRNFNPKVQTIHEEDTKKFSNRSKPRATYDSLFNDSLLSVVTLTSEIRRKQRHLIFNSRKLKENNVDNNVSMLGNTDNDVNDQQETNKGDGTKFPIKLNLTKNMNIKDINYVDKNENNLENGILFSSKISTKGKIEPYMDRIQEEALRESRNLKNIKNTTSLDYKDFVISPFSKDYEKYKKKKKRYDRIEDVESGRKNLMDELTELEKAYDALKKMRSKKGEIRSLKKDESYVQTREDLQVKELQRADNIEKNAKETLLDKRKMKMDAKVNENKMRETRRCFRPRKKKRREKEDRGDSNSRKSMRTLTSRLDEFQARSRLGGEGKIYEDQSHYIEVPKKMEFVKYLLIKNASINGDSKISEKMTESSRENEVFALLTRLLVPDEEILRNFDSVEGRRATRNLTTVKTGNDVPPRFVRRIKKSMRNGRKKDKRKEKHAFSSLSSNSGDLIKNIETNSPEKDGLRSIRVYVQRPDFDLVTDKYLNEPSADFNSSDNPFLIDEDAHRNGIDRRIEEKFGRISEVLKEASDEAKHTPPSSKKQNFNVIDKKTERIDGKKIENFKASRNDEKMKNVDFSKSHQQIKHVIVSNNNQPMKHVDVSKNNQQIKNVDISKNNQQIKNVDVSNNNQPIKHVDISKNNQQIKNVDNLQNIQKTHKFDLPKYSERLSKLTISETNGKRANLNVPWNFDKTENAVDRIGHVEISSKELPTTNFVEFKGGTRPLEKVIPHDKSSFSSNPVNGVERYTKKRPGESADRINVRASNGSKQISDLIISRSRLNSTTVVVDGNRPGRNGVSYLDIENSRIVLRKINSSDDTNLLYKMNEKLKTIGKERFSLKNYSDFHTFNKSNILGNKKNNIKEKEPREILFYEYNFEDDSNDDNHEFGGKSRTLLSISLDDVASADENESFDDSPNLEYEDYTYSKTDSIKDKNEDDFIEDIVDFNSMTPSKSKTYIADNNYEDFNNDTSLYNRNPDKYIKQMSEVIAHRGKTHDTKSNGYANKGYKKIVSRGSKIVKKHVNDVPFYDFISTQEASKDAKKTKNFNQGKNFNFIPENWSEKMNIDDAGIYDQKIDQNHGRDEKSSFVDVSSYNTIDGQLRSSKSLNEKPVIEKTNEFFIDPRKNSDEPSSNIDISVNGSIHVEGGIKGHPISIALVAVPDTQPDSPMISNYNNFDVQKSEDSTNEVIKLNEVVPVAPSNQDYTETNAESMSNAFNNDLDKNKEESSTVFMNNNDDGEFLERNKSLYATLAPQNHIYNDVYKYNGIEKARDDRVTPVQRFYVFNSNLGDVDSKDLNSNENLESAYVDDYEDDSKNLAREKKEVENLQYQVTDGLVNFIESQSNNFLPVSDENVTLVKIIPEKLFDNVPSAMKNDFSNNFEVNSYGKNLSSLEFPFLSNFTPVKFDSANEYNNETNKFSSYNLGDSGLTSMIFPLIFDTTVQPGDILQDWYKDSTLMTTMSKITESDVHFRKMTTIRMSISDLNIPFSKKVDNASITQPRNELRQPEKSELFNETSSLRTTNAIIGDSCYRMKVTVKKLNLIETTTSVPTTTIGTPIKNIDRPKKTTGTSSENKNSSKNWTIRERNAFAVTNFIKKLQAFAPNERQSRLNIREIIIVPEDTDKSNLIKDKSLKSNIKSSLENSNPDKSLSIFLSSSNDALDNSTITAEDSTKENKLRKKTILESNPKLLSRTSKGSFYPSSRDSSRKEQQRQQSSSGSSTKRSLSSGLDGPDKSFLFYAQQKQPVGLPELLVKSQKDGKDIDLDVRSTRKRVFLSRDKRNEEKKVSFPSLKKKKMQGVDEVSLVGRSSNVKEEAEVKSRVDWKKKSAEEKGIRLPRFNKRKLEKRKKKMDAGEIKKLTGIRRRRKKKKKKMKKKLGNRENTLDIPEVKSKWRIVKRNLLSVEGTESGRLKRKLDKKRDDGDLEITRKTYVESNASQVGRVSNGESKKKKKKIEEVEDAGSTLIRRRQSRTDGKQVRGGQDCSNRDHPVDVDESKYLESAHCLRFSDLWYSVYRLDGPILDHGVSVQLYEKRSLPDGTSRWEDLTPSMIRLNTFSRRYRNNDDSLAFTYRAKREPSKQFPPSLDILEDRLLVPSSVSTAKSFKVDESKGIFEEYLIVRANEITENGNECDKIGVGFKAFVDQPDRCERLEGTCLKYQPLSYWKRDREAREAGRAGCYFLSNFASVPSEPIKYNVSGSGSGEFLALEYHSPHVSAIDIEVRNDYNGVASAGPFGRISHIYVDSTSPVHTLVTIVIRNVGSTPTVYRPTIVECPQGLPVSWLNARGIVQMILPKQNRRVAFDLYGELPFDDFECTVKLLDRRGKSVASRKMKVRRMDRCFCVWHCLCACVGGADGSSCRPMSTAHYRAAGFQPPVPETPMRPSSSFLGSLFDFLLFLFSLVALLLIMGISKWIIGIYVPAVRRWGLDTLLESTRMREYFEEELKCRCIVTDESGLPVHPDTGSRSIRICSRKAEFFLNVTFFLIYPIAVCWYRTKEIFHGSSSISNEESKACLTSDRDEYQNLVTVSTYGDGRNSKMEAEDTNYVMNELKKSQESLQEYNRYKRYRYYMENQDSRY